MVGWSFSSRAVLRLLHTLTLTLTLPQLLYAQPFLALPPSTP